MPLGRKNLFAAFAPASLGTADWDAEEMLARSGLPIATCFLILLITTVFGAETHFFTTKPTFFWGANIPRLTFEHHQFWRLLTSQFLHANVSHLVGNSIGLLIAGLFLEPMVGPLWLIIIFVSTAAGGDAIASLFAQPLTASVGASGGIMGLFAFALLAKIFDDEDGDEWFQRTGYVCLRVIVYGLIPSPHVDIFAHLGGAICGVAAYLVVSIWWDDNDDIPSYGARSLGILGIGFYFLTLVGVIVG